MKIIILYESFFGNTEAVARAMGNAAAEEFNSEVKNVSEISWDDVADADILILGSATRGFNPCEKTKSFLSTIPANGLRGKVVAAFDTRIALSTIKSGALRFVVKAGGYAAKRIARSLSKRGGTLAVPPEGFIVTGEKGPLAEGEEERAAQWMQTIADTI